MLRTIRRNVGGMALFFAWAVLFATMPLELMAQTAEQATGSVVGFLYDTDGKSPVKEGILKFKNVFTNQEFLSQPTDDQGAYKVEGLPIGQYTAVATVDKKDYKFEYVIVVVSPNEQAKVNFMLYKRRGCLWLVLLGGGAAVATTAAILLTGEEEPPASPAR
ncbi:MAG: carboxypeptidase-like regulatory domain-containing protein [Acidobacteriota bacterium]